MGALFTIAGLMTLGFACGARVPAHATDAQKRQAIERMFAGYKKQFPNVPELTVNQLVQKQKNDKNLVLVDVRTAKEQAVSMIPGAITQDAFEKHKDQYKDKHIVTYCTIGYRSGLYAKKLRGQGFDAANLKGSILSWTQAGQPLVNKDGKTKRVDVYGPKWNLARHDYTAVW